MDAVTEHGSGATSSGGAPPSHGEAVCHLPKTQPDWQAGCQHLCASSAGLRVLCMPHLQQAAHARGCAQGVQGGVAAGGIHRRIKNYHHQQNINKKRVFSCYSDFSLFSLKFPIDFDQIQVRFTSLVNLGIWKGKKIIKKKKCVDWFQPKEKEGRRLCQAGFPKFSQLDMLWLRVCSRLQARLPNNLDGILKRCTAGRVLEEVGRDPKHGNPSHLQKAELSQAPGLQF